MHDALTMSFVERIDDLNAIAQDLLDRKRPLQQTISECLAFQIFHDEKIRAVLVADIVERADVRMIQTRHGVRFALHALPQLCIANQIGAQDFDGYITTEFGIARQIHLTHTARAELRADFITAKPCARWNRRAHRAFLDLC